MSDVCQLLSNIKEEDNSLNTKRFIDNECKVCYETIYPEDATCPAVELFCNHRFHYQCIELSYQYSSTYRQCPYCRQYGGWLPLIPTIKPKKNIHREYVSIRKRKKSLMSKYLLKKQKKIKKTIITSILPTQTLSVHTCQAIIKSGPKKGAQCTHSKKHGDYCGRHKKFHIISI